MAISQEIETRDKPVSKAGKRSQAHETGIILGQWIEGTEGQIGRCVGLLWPLLEGGRLQGMNVVNCQDQSNKRV